MLGEQPLMRCMDKLAGFEVLGTNPEAAAARAAAGEMLPVGAADRILD